MSSGTGSGARLIKNLVRNTFWIFGRPFEAVRADYRVSRRDGWISAGRVRPRSAPRGLEAIWEPFFGGRNFGEKTTEEILLKPQAWQD